MAEDRITTSMRYRRSMLRSLAELDALQGGISREATVHLLLLEGLAVRYAQLGIEKDPAVMAGELLRVISAAWESELSDEEIQALKVTRAALDRIAQVRSRETAPGG